MSLGVRVIATLTVLVGFGCAGLASIALATAYAIPGWAVMMFGVVAGLLAAAVFLLTLIAWIVAGRP